jgi:trehalose 6-phosphate phosphatase
VTVEAKPASVALHVRNADPDDAAAALAAARVAAADWPAELTEGKAVLEFAVITTDKGEAIDIMRRRMAANAVVYFGDDVTDEKAFRRLHHDSDVGVKVGPGDTLAQHRVSSPSGVAGALMLLAQERGRKL